MNTYLKKLLFYLPIFTLAVTILTRIKHRYPYIFAECTTDEELKELSKKEDNE